MALLFLFFSLVKETDFPVQFIGILTKYSLITLSSDTFLGLQADGFLFVFQLTDFPVIRFVIREMRNTMSSMPMPCPNFINFPVSNTAVGDVLEKLRR